MKHNRLVLACVCGSLGLVTALLGVAGFAGIRALVDFPKAPAGTSADRRTQWGERLRDAS